MFERLKEMDRRALIPLLLAGVIGILLFSTIAGGIRQAGWNEGFMVGLLAGGGDQAKAIAPALAYGGAPGLAGAHGWGGHGIGFFGGFFRFLFFGFLLITFFKFLRFWRWRIHGGHPWHHHHHGPWGHHQGPWGQRQGPWSQHHERPYGQQPGGEPPADQGNQPPPPPAQPEMNRPQPVSWVKV